VPASDNLTCAGEVPGTVVGAVDGELRLKKKSALLLQQWISWVIIVIHESDCAAALFVT